MLPGGVVARYYKVHQLEWREIDSELPQGAQVSVNAPPQVPTRPCSTATSVTRQVLLASDRRQQAAPGEQLHVN